MRAALLLVLLAAAPARAAFVRSVMDRVDTEPLFDSEYFLDLRAFSWPRAWDDAWAASSGGYRVNGASLDCCDLYLDQGLVFARRLTPRLEFRFRYTDLEDKDRQETHHWLELETRLGRGWSAEVFGEPAFRKEDADIGLGVRWRRDGGQFRLRRNAVDFNFNSRGSTSQRYSLKPYTYELFAESGLGAGALRLWAELDSPTRRDDPAAFRSFGYRREQVRLGWESDQGWAPRVAWSFERQRKQDRYATAAAGTSTDAVRRVHTLTASLRRRAGDRDEFEPGIAYMTRAARADDYFASAASVAYRRWEVQPWLRWRREASTLILWELSPFLSLGEDRLRRGNGTFTSRVVTEAKIGGALEFRFSKTAWLALNTNFDADTPGKFWDGGNIRAMFLF